MRPQPTLPQPKPLPRPGQGIAVISERESLGDGFYKLHLLRALKRAYAQRLTSLGDASEWLKELPPTAW